MSTSMGHSDYCLVFEAHKEPPRPPLTPIWTLRVALLQVDGKTHFTGARGLAWRLLGVNRHPKNPNLCNF